MWIKALKGIAITFILIVTGYLLRIDRFGLSQISWIDCLKINDIKYISDFQRTEVDASIVGEQIGVVRFTIHDNVHNASYHFRNGDATYLDQGTKIYKAKSTEHSDAVIVQVEDSFFIYKQTK